VRRFGACRVDLLGDVLGSHGGVELDCLKTDNSVGKIKNDVPE